MAEKYQIYCDADEKGEIVEPMVGRRIVPDRQTEFFFLTEDEDKVNHLFDYRIDLETRELVKKEDSE